MAWARFRGQSRRPPLKQRLLGRLLCPSPSQSMMAYYVMIWRHVAFSKSPYQPSMTPFYSPTIDWPVTCPRRRPQCACWAFSARFCWRCWWSPCAGWVGSTAGVLTLRTSPRPGRPSSCSCRRIRWRYSCRSYLFPPAMKKKKFSIKVVLTLTPNPQL